MLHSIFKHSLSKKQHVKKKYLVGFVCVGIVLISFLIYTVIFLRDTNTVEKCLAYPYANASQLKKIENETAEENCCVAYLSMQNDDGIQEMYLLKNKRFLGTLDVQRYIVLQHQASVMEKVGFFPTLSPSDVQAEPIDWYFYSQNELQIENMVCTFNTNGGAQSVQYFSCNPNEPFICCLPEMQGNLRLESMIGYNSNGEQVYTFNTGLFSSI